MKALYDTAGAVAPQSGSNGLRSSARTGAGLLAVAALAVGLAACGSGNSPTRHPGGTHAQTTATQTTRPTVPQPQPQPSQGGSGGGTTSGGGGGTTTSAWSHPSVIDPSGSLTAVSCPSPSFCAAVDGHGNALTFNGASWSAPTRIDSLKDGEGAGGLSAVSCVSSSFCVTVDTLGNASIYRGSTWSTPVQIAPFASPEGAALTSVSCPTTTFCVALDHPGYAITFNGTTWSKPQRIGPFQGSTSVSCASPTFCAAIDMQGHAQTFDGAKWSTPKLVEPFGADASLGSLSCPSKNFCAAVITSSNARFDNDGDVVTYDGTSWSTPKHIDRVGYPESVSCTSSTSCASVDLYGYALTRRGNSWSPAVKVTNSVGLTSFLLSVSCGSASFCVAVDLKGEWVHTGTVGSVPVTSAKPVFAGDAPFTCAPFSNEWAPGKLTVRSGDDTLVVTVDGPAAPSSLSGDGEETATLSHDGQVVSSASFAGPLVSFASLGPDRGGACITRAPHGGAAVALVGLYEGGAHGPVMAQVLYPDGQGRYRKAQLVFDQASFADVEYSQGRLVFMSHDPRFAYEWTAFAFSGFPILLQALQGGRLVDVTAQYPALVSSDAAQWYARATSPGYVKLPGQDGAYAAWAADECRLFGTATVWSKLGKLAAAGVLDENGIVTGSHFVAELEQQLVADHICVAPSPSSE